MIIIKVITLNDGYSNGCIDPLWNNERVLCTLFISPGIKSQKLRCMNWDFCVPVFVDEMNQPVLTAVNHDDKHLSILTTHIQQNKLWKLCGPSFLFLDHEYTFL